MCTGQVNRQRESLKMVRGVAVLSIALLSLGACGQSPSSKSAVRLTAVADSTAPAIALFWEAFPGSSAFSVYRRPQGATTWGAALASLPGAALSWTDTAVSVGTPYEYKLVRSASGNGYGYVSSGIAVPPNEIRGKLVLLVESGVAALLTAELDQLVEDLWGDGWMVLRHDVGSSDPVTAVRALVQADHAAYPGQVKAVYVVGHVPVPYSGNTNPDGHNEHRGAWACDGYYGEMTSTWNDVTVNNMSGSFPHNHNVPGDGKFDHSDFPSSVELAVGRVDLSRLPAFALPEVELLRGYLHKAHAFKTRQFTVLPTAVINDDLQWVSNPLGSTGYKSSIPCVGPAAFTELVPSLAPFSDHFLVTDDLWSYHSSSGVQLVDSLGGTRFVGTANGLTTAELATNQHGAIFNMSFGSYYGDWDNTDNMLRAMIAGGNPLTHVWSGIPNWFFHPMAMGETIGACALRSMNNTNADYSLQNGGWQGQGMVRAHMGLMGDPSLRMRYVAPPSGLVATNTSWYASFTWSPSPDMVEGYYLYKVDSVNGQITRITPALVTDTFHVSTTQFFPGDRYMVRAMALTTSPSGSYYDLSLGALAIAQGTQVSDCLGIIGGTAIPGTACDDVDPNTGNDLLDTLCICSGLPFDCEGVPGGSATIGSTCDDGNQLTINDAYDAACICVGIVDGISETAASPIRVGPVPCNDALDVSSDVVLRGTLSIRALNGSLVRDTVCNGKQVRIDVRALANGTYVLTYTPSDAERGERMARFTVQH